MKRFGLFISIALVVTVSSLVSASVPLSDTRIEIIRNNCTQAQATMQRVLRGDAVSRVNRGRAYENMMKLLAAFNSRAALNTYNISNLIQVTESFESEFSAFKTAYTNYDAALNSAVKINCKDQPAVFYDALVKTRELRATLGVHIGVMNSILNEYSTGLSQIKVEDASTN